ncbi:MAG: ADP-ribosylglycohydrolase family protein, partial [Chloroflexota bacterium]
PVHAINNTAVLVLALLYGQGDYERTICTAVMCGLDTDCNGANAGSVMGIITGARALPAKWTDPLQDTLYSDLARFSENRISDLAHRTVRLAQEFLSLQPS